MPKKKTEISTAATAKPARGRPKRTTKTSASLKDFEIHNDSDSNEPHLRIRRRNAMKLPFANKNGSNKTNHDETSKSSREAALEDLEDSVAESMSLTSKKDMNIGKRQSDHSFSLVPDDQSTPNISLQDCDSEIDHQHRKTKKPVPVKTRAPKKRKLRPEDERTLKILSEKFRDGQDGAVCQVPSCSKTMKCNKPSNLKRHLSKLHPNIYANLFPHEVSEKKQNELEAFNTVQDAIEMVTINGYPFVMLNASGMQGFIKSRLQSIRTAGHSVFINRYEIVKQVAAESQLIKERIAKELKGKTISLMFDVCTIATLSMLGVHAVFMEGEEAIVRSLGTIQIEKRHTSVNLADMLFDILAKFNVTLPQVLSITTDTAKNAIATSEVLNLVVNNNNDKSDGDSIADDSIFDVDPDDDGELDFGLDIENELELQKVIDNLATQTKLVEEMASNIAVQSTSIEVINQINCGTHVLQLAINAAIDESTSKDTIAMVHDMCILLRTQVVMIEVRKLKCKVILPPLDNATRWNSKYTMCRDFLKMKDVINQLTNCAEFGYKFEVNGIFWTEIEEINNVLQPAYNLTIDMQRAGFGLSDLYIGWLRVQKNLQRTIREGVKFDLAENLMKKMEARASSLFKSPLMLCAVYLDPRINFKLSVEQKASAAMDLIKIHERLTNDIFLNRNKEQRMNDTLDEIQEEYQTQRNSNHLSTDRVLQQLSLFEVEKPYDIRAPVMQFWGENTNKYPLIRPLADHLHAVPSNQCCVERSFSSLSYIRSKYRMSMNPQNLSNILMIRLNKEVYRTLRCERIQKILNR